MYFSTRKIHWYHQ